MCQEVTPRDYQAGGICERPGTCWTPDRKEENMSMRIWMSVGMVAMLANSGTAAPGDGGLVIATDSVVEGTVTCPDPPNCTLSNGTGVYFTERGAAAIDNIRFLITHFKNINDAHGKRVA